MKIALIIPRNGLENEPSFYDLKFVSSFLFSRKYFSYLLAIPTLISLTPPGHEIRVFDENIEDIDYNWGAVLVGISVRTMFATRAYEIADNFRKRGVKTVLGGIHPSFCPEEALEHSDSVVVGEAEGIWPELLEDARNNRLRKIYQADSYASLTSSSGAVRSLMSQKRYFADIVQTTKGCPYTCEFCSVYAFDGQKIRNKPIDIVLREIRDIQCAGTQLNKKSIFFADDNIIANKKYAIELFRALQPYRLNWSCQASINISKEDDLLRLMKDSGCGSILIGLESVSSQNLTRMNKRLNLRFNYLDAIQKIQSYGILVHGSFILGSDFDDLSAFDELIHFIKEAKLLMPLINILTPFPGTELHKRLDAEGRILHKEWSKYDARHVVFKPALMSPEELADGYKKVIREVYSFENIYNNLQYYWGLDFWRHSNKVSPVRFRLRMLFAARLCTLLGYKNPDRTKFIIKIFPRLFDRHVRLSTVLTLMAYNEFAYTV
ncbi:MAG: radical SAM protein [Nitrospirota bacterium]